MSEKPILPKLDLKDRKILLELDMDARIPVKQLAKKVGVSRQVAQYRIERMKKDGIISNSLTIFDSALVGKRWFRIVLQLRKITAGEKQEFIEFFKAHPNVLWLGEVGGNWDFVINFVCEDQFGFDQLFSKILERWGKSIQRYEILVYINVRDQQRSYIVSEEEKQQTQQEFLFHEMKNNSGISLDALDKQIIRKISKNADLSYSEIASSLDISYKTVQNRMDIMRKNGLILGYRTLVNPGKLGYESYMVFLGTNAYDAKLESALDEFLKHQNVTFVVRQLGRWRIGLETEFRNRNEFQAFLVELRTRFADIISEYETFPIFFDHTVDYFPRGALGDDVIMKERKTSKEF